MVVHSPDAFEAKKAAAAAAVRAREVGAAVGGAATGAADDTGVPPSVLAAGPNPVLPATSVTPAEEADLLGDEDQAIVHDFGAWGDDRSSTRADVHGGGEKEKDDISVSAGRRGQRLTDGLTSPADDDKISVAGSIHGNSTPAADQLNPFTPEWFAQIIGAATKAAATAAATAVAAAPRHAAATGTSNPAVPRRLNDRKVPDFWEDRPEFWFKIFDAHLAHFNPTEKVCFDALLPLLTPAARSTVNSVCLLYTSDAADE